MARLRPPNNGEPDDELEKYMEEAREAAIRKKAQLIAERELGLVAEDSSSKTVKGPLKKLAKDHVITLDLAEHSDRLVIDSTTYFHGRTYTVDKATYDLMREIIHRGWEHQREIDGKNATAYRTQANIQLSPKDVINTRESLLNGNS
jgi:ferritin-like protein